ncbi:hypothetical protein SAMN04244548_01230 [Paracoccus pantotrophus]|nr:hypothetical protein SAMN04244548_01230 [Paracoccus pantotrophus]
MAYLEGDLAPFKTIKDRRALVGKNIRYLRHCDIDRSGRGYLFPRTGKVVGVERRTLILDTTYVETSDLVEVVVIPPASDGRE